MIAVFVTDTASANYTVYSQIGKYIHMGFTLFRREWWEIF